MTRIVGREAELERVDWMLDDLQSGVTVSVEGEPGIGKTRLLAELAARAEERHFLVLEGRASEGEGDVPFAPFLDALDDYLASVNPRLIKPRDAEGRTELARIFPSLAELAEGGTAAVQEERYRSHTAVRTLLESLAEKRPLLLSLDDLHWADSASVELVSHLVRHPPRARVLIVAGFRPAHVRERLLAELGAVERIELDPLDDEQARELIAELADRDTAGEILRLSGGNPFYLEQLARGWDAAAGPFPAPEPGGEWPDVPAEVTTAIERELGRLGKQAGLMLRGAAVVGEGFDPELAGHAAGLGPGDALAALDELLAADLVRRTDVPRRFRFRHPIVRQAVDASAPAGWQLGAHGRVAAMLAERGATATARAHHVELAASPGDAAAIELLTEAGAAAAARAPSAAAHWFAAALRLVPESDPGRRLGLLIPRARALAACGRYDDSLRDLDEVLSMMPAGDPILRGRVIASAAKVKQLIGRHGEAHRELEGALASLPDQGSPEASTLKLELAADSFFAGDQEEFERWVRAALDDAERRDDAAMAAAATGLHSSALYMRDDVGAARVELDRALRLIAALPEAGLAAHLNAHTWTALGAVYMERFDAATSLLDRTIEAALAAGQGHLPTLMRTTQALAQINQGRLEEAFPRLEAAVDASILTRNPVFLAWARALQCWATLIAGDLPAALRLGELALEGAGDDPLSATAACSVAAARLAGGDAAGARDELLARAGGEGLGVIERGFRARGFEILARAEIGLGDLEQAELCVERAAEAAQGLGIDGRTADVLRARAVLELARSEPAAARPHAERAAEAAERAGLAIDAARGRALAARARAEADDEEGGRADLERARDEFARLGAGHYADQAAAELRGLGVRVARSERAVERDGLDALSAREREIAELVAAGKRNREIADSLFLSVRTVEGHLARVFRKLDVSSRTELASRVSGSATPRP
jgi:DNA-binding CsgD family transcriptional regulator